jgi:hypothetical protein
VRSLALLTVAILVAIGVGVGIEATTGHQFAEGPLNWPCEYTYPPAASPGLAGVNVWPIETFCVGPEEPAPINGGMATKVQVAHRSDDGSVVVGPVVLGIADYSDTHLFVAYGPRIMWLYAAITTDGSRALEVSGSSGQVLKSIRMPSLSHASGFANASGLWIRDGDQGDRPRGIEFHVLAATGRVIEFRDHLLFPRCIGHRGC